MRKIEEMYAFCASDREDDEGIIGFRGPDNSWVPLVGADMARVSSLRCMAISIGQSENLSVVLKKFKLVSEDTVYTTDAERKSTGTM